MIREKLDAWRKTFWEKMTPWLYDNDKLEVDEALSFLAQPGDVVRMRVQHPEGLKFWDANVGATCQATGEDAKTMMDIYEKLPPEIPVRFVLMRPKSGQKEFKIVEEFEV